MFIQVKNKAIKLVTCIHSGGISSCSHPVSAVVQRPSLWVTFRPNKFLLTKLNHTAMFDYISNFRSIHVFTVTGSPPDRYVYINLCRLSIDGFLAIPVSLATIHFFKHTLLNLYLNVINANSPI